MSAARRRLLSRGDLPGSDGGLYNPGAWSDGDRIELLVRREIDYRFTPIVHAERVTLDAATLEIRAHRTLVRRGYPAGARIEDFRPLRFGGETLCVHTMVDHHGIRPVLARVTDREIAYEGPIALPTATTPIEKNWVLFEHGGELHCLYRLDPLTIFVRARGGRWRLRKRVDNGWGASFTGMLSNSANLVPFAGGHLGFWHSIVDDRRAVQRSSSPLGGGAQGALRGDHPPRYVQGAMLLDANLDLACATGALLDGRDAAPGHKPGVLYVSSLVVRDGRVLAFYGEGDAHAGVASFDARALEATLGRHPFVPREPITVRLAPASMGELYHAMVDLDERARDDPRPLWVHVPDERLHDIVRRFGVRGLTLRELSRERRFDYDVGARTRRAMAPRD